MMKYILYRLAALRHDQAGATAVEYAILVGIVGAALAAGAQVFGSGLEAVFTGLLTKVNLG